MRGKNWVEAGSLLISTLNGTDDYFSQSVVLILDYDQDGALGVTLNKFSQFDINEVLAEWADLVSPPSRLFSGGPVSPNGAICLAQVQSDGEEPPGWQRVKGNFGLLHLDTPVEIVHGAFTDLRIYSGYSGWAPQQLDYELEQKMWVVAKYQESDIFTADPGGLWQRILRRQKWPISLLSTWSEQTVLN